MIAKSDQKQYSNQMADKYLDGVFQIGKKIYPENHPIIRKTQHFIDTNKLKCG